MKAIETGVFGKVFERTLIGLLSIGTGAILIYLAVQGPLITGQIRYKTDPVINNQIEGQDLVNLVLIGPLMIATGVLLLMGKPISRNLILLTPLYLIYYALSYTVGWEWSAIRYTGNSELYTFHFLFVLISSLISLLYGLSVFPKGAAGRFRKTGLAVYSAFFTLFLLIFASMWIKEVVEVMKTGTARGYDTAPTAFWAVRVFDLGFSIPLGLISVYLLWARPDTSFPVQFLFYGFFLTMIVAVDAMAVLMWLRKDPTFLMRDLAVFFVLAVIIICGFIYILKNYRLKDQ